MGEIPGLGERIKEARKAAGMTQVERAEQMGVAQPSIHHWKQGSKTPSAERLVDLCRELRVSAYWLLGLKKDHSQTAAAPLARKRLRETPFPWLKSHGSIEASSSDSSLSSSSSFPWLKSHGSIEASAAVMLGASNDSFPWLKSHGSIEATHELHGAPGGDAFRG